MPQSSLNSKLIFRVAIAVPLYKIFDYSVPGEISLEKLTVGIRLLVPFGKQTKVAYLVEISSHSELSPEALKPIISILDLQPLLSAEDLKLLHWASSYYHHPIGEVISAAFPVLLRKGRQAEYKQPNVYQLSEKGQNLAVLTLKNAPRQLALLEHFQTISYPLSAIQLSASVKNWRPPLKALIDKQLIEVVHQISPANEQSITRQPPLPANDEQQVAIDRISQSLNKFQVFLLEGVTGSGKTEVYMQVIDRVLAQGKQVLVLLPEITLTPQLQQRFQERFTQVIAVYHSSLTEKTRLNAWLNMQQGNSSIMLGTRSALFTPFSSPGLIILDEEHDSSFKQQEGFRFSARDVAIVRARNLNIPIVLGSATPSLESLHNVKRKRYELLHLAKRAGQALKPELKLLDIRNKQMTDGLSAPLISTIKKHLAKQEQVLIFLNRRGFAPALICHGCGWVARCQYCDANLVVHHQQQHLRCHHCGREQVLIKQCMACRSQQLTPLGLGTERVEQALAQIFPDQKIVRLDRDTTSRKGDLERLLDEIHRGTGRIILGTQMLAKGHHFPNVTLVALLDVDSGLFSIDFHATERLAQLIVQVAGRAGRAEKKGKVILQTRQPDHVLLKTMIYKDYRAFSTIALEERQQAQLPPFSHQAILRASAMDSQMPITFLNQVVQLMAKKNNNQTLILGPTPAPMTRRAGLYRYQLLFQNKQRKYLHEVLDSLINQLNSMKKSSLVRWTLDVDPVDLY